MYDGGIFEDVKDLPRKPPELSSYSVLVRDVYNLVYDQVIETQRSERQRTRTAKGGTEWKETQTVVRRLDLTALSCVLSLHRDRISQIPSTTALGIAKDVIWLFRVLHGDESEREDLEDIPGDWDKKLLARLGVVDLGDVDGSDT